MRSTRSAALIAGVLLAAGLTACSSSSNSGAAASHGLASAAAAAEGGVQTLTVHATDQLRFKPADLVVHVGTVRITLIDDGSYPHNLSVPAQHSTSKTVIGDPGGQRTTITLRFSQPGSYHFECTYHASAGMTGTITVRT